MWVLSAVAVILGLVGGGAAVGLFKLIGLITHLALFGDVGFDLPTLRGYHPSPLLIVVAVGGGLIVSVFAAWAPVIRGHGIPESLEAILDRDSRIRPRAAVAKPLSAAITIGTGGPFGAEGPIIVTGGSVGSLIGQLLSVSPAERKIMLATGAAAGMSATFNTPIAAVILAIELVLFERSLRVIVPLSIASGIAAAIHIVAFGAEPLFMISTQLHVGLAHLPLFALVGLASGVLAIVLNKGLFAMEAAFRRLPVNIFWWPAIGALGFALIGLAVPRTLSMGYSAIVDTLNGQFTVVALAVLFGAKLLSWLIALGSQTSGGTLAPMFLVGATMGCLLGHAVDAVWPALHVSPAAFALVAMGATFGAATKALLAAVVFAAEVTGQYTMIIPLLIGAGVAELVAEAFLSDRMMTEKLSHRGFRVEFRTVVDALRTRVAGQVMREPAVVRSDATISQARRAVAGHGLSRIGVVRPDGRYLGLLAAGDLDKVADAGRPVGELATSAVAPIRVDEFLSTALDRLLADRVDALPVVENGRVVGLLSREDITAERYGRGTAQELRQAGWLASIRWPWYRPPARRPDTIGSAAAARGSHPHHKIVIQPGPDVLLRHRNGVARPSRPGAGQPRTEPRESSGRLGASSGAAPPPAPTDIGPIAPQRNSPGRKPMESTVGSTVTHSTAGRMPRRPAHGRLLPDPVQVTPGLGQFVLSERSRIVLAWGSAAARPIAERLAAELRPATGFRLSVSDGRAYRDDICLHLGPADGLPDEAADEGYTLEVGVSGVRLTAPALHGLHNGTQTIRQLLPVWIASRDRVPGPWTMPAVTIVDFPRFGYRGLKLDLTRQVLSPAAVVQFVDRVAGYKLDGLHLRFSAEHAARLTAATPPTVLPPGFRLAADPDADGGGMRTGGYWTALEYQQVIQHAADRFVTVIPEVDPLGPDGERRWPGTARIVDRLAAMTPGSYVALGAADPADTPATWEMVGDLAAVGKVALRPTADGYASAGAATAPGDERVLLSPVGHAVFDEPATGAQDRGLGAFFCWEPADCASDGREEQILGVQACMPQWSAPSGGQVEEAVFPRILSTAEVGWSPRVTRTESGPVFADFLARVGAQGPRLALTGTRFDAAEAIPWRLDLTVLPLPVRDRNAAGVVGILVAPGFGRDTLRVTVDWGDGCIVDGDLASAAAGAGSQAGRYSITPRHRYRRGGTYRVAVTVTGPDVVPARASAMLRAGMGGRLPSGRRSARAATGGAAGRPAIGPAATAGVTRAAPTTKVESPSA